MCPLSAGGERQPGLGQDAIGLMRHLTACSATIHKLYHHSASTGLHMAASEKLALACNDNVGQREQMQQSVATSGDPQLHLQMTCWRSAFGLPARPSLFVCMAERLGRHLSVQHSSSPDSCQMQSMQIELQHRRGKHQETSQPVQLRYTALRQCKAYLRVAALGGFALASTRLCSEKMLRCPPWHLTHDPFGDASLF